MVMWLYRWKRLTLTHHSAKFGDFSHGSSEDKRFEFVPWFHKTTWLNCQVTLSVGAPHGKSLPFYVYWL